MVLSVQWKGFGRSQCITALKIRQKIIKTMFPVLLKSLSHCTVEQTQWDAITEVSSITVLREKLFGRGCLSTISLLWWLCISNAVASHFRLKLPSLSWGGRICILIWQLRNRKSKQKPQNSEATIPSNLSSFHICADFVRIHQETEGKTFSYPLDQ